MKRFRLVALVFVVACSGTGIGPMDASTEGGSKDSGGKDATTMMDSGGSDAQPSDSGSDGGSGDASDGGGGDGAVSAQCTVPATPPSAGSCVTIDDAGFQCNPVTNAPCDVDAGLGCDNDLMGHYKCLAQSTVALCGACNEVSGPWCIGTATCLPLTDAGTQQCFRYCCADSDCSPGHCDKSTFGISPLGACAQ